MEYSVDETVFLTGLHGKKMAAEKFEMSSMKEKMQFRAIWDVFSIGPDRDHKRSANALPQAILDWDQEPVCPPNRTIEMGGFGSVKSGTSGELE